MHREESRLQLSLSANILSGGFTGTRGRADTSKCIFEEFEHAHQDVSAREGSRKGLGLNGCWLEVSTTRDKNEVQESSHSRTRICIRRLDKPCCIMHADSPCLLDHRHEGSIKTALLKTLNRFWSVKSRDTNAQAGP